MRLATMITGLLLAAALQAPARRRALGRCGRRRHRPAGRRDARRGVPRRAAAQRSQGNARRRRPEAPLALGSWLAFVRHGGEVMAMGDLVLTDDEVNPVMARLIEGGFEITALHNHLLRNTPHTMYMHVAGHGDPANLAATLHDALARSGTPLTAPGPAGADAPLDLDTAMIDATLGQKGKAGGGVYAIGIPRAETPRDGGMELPPAMGAAIAINFQPTGSGKAAITGDFVLTAAEVNPVLRALRASGIEVTAVHNHMLDDQPRLFFMHFWANDDAGKLAKGLAAALAHVAVAKS